MTRFRLDIAYDGTAFSGWATQPGFRTVQGELETWIPQVLRLRSATPLTCAGRTDAGVHARGQVAHVELPVTIDSGRTGSQPTEVVLTHRLSRVLPADVVVGRVSVAPEGFDARFSALWRRYVYRIADGVPDPLRRTTTLHYRDRLDVDAMNAAATGLLGLNDFASFCKSRAGATTVRDLRQLHTVRTSMDTVETTVAADAFCHSMVRALMGALTAVGSGARGSDWPASVLAARSRAGVPVLPPEGLTLEEVGYPPDAGLAARAVEARAFRSLPGQADQEDT